MTSINQYELGSRCPCAIHARTAMLCFMQQHVTTKVYRFMLCIYVLIVKHT